MEKSTRIEKVNSIQIEHLWQQCNNSKDIWIYLF